MRASERDARLDGENWTAKKEGDTEKEEEEHEGAGRTEEAIVECERGLRGARVVSRFSVIVRKLLNYEFKKNVLGSSSRGR